MWRKVGCRRNRKAKQRQLRWCVSCPADAINLAPHSCSQSTYIKAHHHHQENIAKIANAALHKCPGKSSLIVCLSSLTCLWLFSLEVVAKCLPKWPTWKVLLPLTIPGVLRKVGIEMLGQHNTENNKISKIFWKSAFQGHSLMDWDFTTGLSSLMMVTRQCPLLKTYVHCLIFVVTDRKFGERVRIGRHLGPTVISESILVKLCHKSQHVPRVSPRVRNLIKPTSESFEQQEIIFASPRFGRECV